jgi:phage gp45-like
MRQTSFALRGVVLAVNDSGAVQTVDVETHPGVVRSQVPVLAPYGFSAGPAAGSVVILLPMGGDAGDLVAMPASLPGGRQGSGAAGEVALADAQGNRVIIRAGGIVEVHAATTIKLVAPVVEITGDVTVTGTLTAQTVRDATGSMATMRTQFNAHRHGSGPGPTPPMT